ncbi:hypothetical protein PanWU01x14_057260, partial [Parasponia andersonii]
NYWMHNALFVTTRWAWLIFLSSRFSLHAANFKNLSRSYSGVYGHCFLNKNGAYQRAQGGSLELVEGHIPTSSLRVCLHVINLLKS